MQPKDDNSGALSLLSQLDRSLPQYQVPEAYFNVFPQRILQLVSNQEADVRQAGMHTGLGLPLPDPSALPYRLPEGYFSAFPIRIVEKINMECFDPSGDALKADSAKQHPFVLDQNDYFDHIGTQVLNRIRQNSAQRDDDVLLSPELAALKSRQAFEVPDGYFDAPVYRTAIQKPLVPVHPAHKSIKWSSWIAAAGILLIFTLGGRGLFVNPSASVPVPDRGVELALNAIPEQEIAEYLEMTMSEYELAGFFADHTPWDKLIDEQASEALLNDIPVDDIKAYIESGGI